MQQDGWTARKNPHWLKPKKNIAVMPELTGRLPEEQTQEKPKRNPRAGLKTGATESTADPRGEEKRGPDKVKRYEE